MQSAPAQPPSTQTASGPAGRISSLDQYRGFAIFGMLIVNHLGEFQCMPEQFRHHNTYMTFADIIAPLFMFVVGMGFRLSLQRRIQKDGARVAYTSSLKRYFALVCVGIVLYDPSPEQWRYWWDALVDIGFGAILGLPFMMRSIPLRALAAAGYWIVYQCIFSFTAYGAWTFENSIDGGPLGPFSWAPILLLGTVAYDLLSSRNHKTIVNGCLLWGGALCIIGIALYFPVPGVKDRWLFSQTSMQLPYPVLASGICFLLYLPFYYFNDVMKRDIPTLALIGMNPLIIYILQNALGDMYGPSYIVPENCSWPLALLDFIFLYGCCWIVAWKLKKDKVIIKL